MAHIFISHTRITVSFIEGQDGNYIFAKIVDGNWRPIYIGEGDLGKRISQNHHKAECITSKGATHVHMHLNPVEKDRLKEEQDLLANYTQAMNQLDAMKKLVGN